MRPAWLYTVAESQLPWKRLFNAALEICKDSGSSDHGLRWLGKLESHPTDNNQ